MPFFCFNDQCRLASLDRFAGSFENGKLIAFDIDLYERDVVERIGIDGSRLDSQRDFIRFGTTLTADRAVTLSTTSVWSGCSYKIVRPAAGAFNLNVGSGPLKALAAGTWCEVTYDGFNWILTGYGSL